MRKHHDVRIFFPYCFRTTIQATVYIFNAVAVVHLSTYFVYFVPYHYTSYSIVFIGWSREMQGCRHHFSMAFTQTKGGLTSHHDSDGGPFIAYLRKDPDIHNKCVHRGPFVRWRPK